MTEADEHTFEHVQRGLIDAERIMAERGYTEAQITQEYLGRAIFNLWSDDEDREALRAKVHAAASTHVDSLMNAVGEKPISVLQRGIERAVNEVKASSKYPEFDDPTFIARVRAYHDAEEKKFYTWLATADFEALIDNAIQVGTAAYAVAPNDASDADRHRSWVSIDLGQRHNVKPMILALRARDIGELLPHDLTYIVYAREFIDLTGVHWRAEHEAIEAFAMALTKPGFEMSIMKSAAVRQAA